MEKFHEQLRPIVEEGEGRVTFMVEPPGKTLSFNSSKGNRQKKLTLLREHP